MAENPSRDTKLARFQDVQARYEAETWDSIAEIPNNF